MNRIKLCGIPIDALTMQQTIDKIEHSIKEKRLLHHVVVNAAKIVNAQKNAQLKESIVNCDIINADGQAVVWASRFLNTPLPERVAGIDLMNALIDVAGKKGYKVYLLGAKEEVITRVVDIYRSKYGHDFIAGYRNGYFNKEEEAEIAENIGNSNADMLFVAMSSPKKEIFLDKYKHTIKAYFIMGVGGSFDIVSGLTKRAPAWMQKIGMEWFYRLIQEPQRMWKRYLVTNSGFIYIIFREKLKQLNHRRELA